MQYRLGGRGLQRPNYQSVGELPSRAPSRFLVRNPRFPPLEAAAAPLAPKVIYLAGAERCDVSAALVDGLKRNNPGWAVEVFGELDCLQYLETYWFEDHTALFKSMSTSSAKCNFWAACVLYTHGGCFLDPTVALRRPLQSFVVPGADACTLGSGSERNRLDPRLLMARPRTKLMARVVGRFLATAGLPPGHREHDLSFTIFVSLIQEAGARIPENSENVYTTKVGERVQILECVKRDSKKYPLKARWQGKRVLWLRAN